jgi:asparagine synthase (glutamine-hydrolysing)
MGSFANNHFLGVIPRLKREGVENLLTGCYCDYLFKGLPLNRDVNWFTGSETLGRFRHEFYFPHARATTRLAHCARERWEGRIPGGLRKQDGASSVFQVEARRTFPLCYEGDNQQRLVPQRVTGWCPPFIDREVLDVYTRLPYNLKLNRSVFQRTVVAAAPGLRTLVNANTGAPPDAHPVYEWLRSRQVRLARSFRPLRRSASTDGSWPDWRQYLAQSSKLENHWRRSNRSATDLFRRVLGPAGYPEHAETLKRDQPFMFVGMLTVKLWLEQRGS